MIKKKILTYTEPWSRVQLHVISKSLKKTGSDFRKYEQCGHNTRYIFHVRVFREVLFLCHANTLPEDTAREHNVGPMINTTDNTHIILAYILDRYTDL